MERDLRDLDDLLGRLVIRQKRADQRLFDLERLETQGDASRAWAQAVGMLQLFPGLVGLWPMTVHGDESAVTVCRDISGNDLFLFRNGDPLLNVDGLAPYIEFDGAGDYLNDGNAFPEFDITGTEGHVASGVQGLTLGGWFFADAGGLQGLISKFITSSDDRSYQLTITNGDKIRFGISSNGTSGGSQTVETSSSITTGQWFFAAGRFTPSSELKAWHNENTATNTSSIAASIFNSAADFQIAAIASAGGFPFDGRASLCFLCAAAVPDSQIQAFYQYSKGLFS